MDAIAQPRAPGAADELAFGDSVAALHKRARQMRVHGHDSVLVPELDDEPVALEVPEPTDGDHLARERRIHLRVRPSADVDAFVEAAPAITERRLERPVQ